MPALFSTSPSLQNLGPRITVKISPSAALIRSLTSPEEIEKYNKVFSAVMVIDTGASCSMIDKGVASYLGLKKHGDEKIVTPSGEKECQTYDVNFNFDSHKHTAPNLRVIEGNFKEKQGIDGLIGRDILKNGLLVYQGFANQYTLSF